ncbi:autophagy-related protein 27 [Lineolata rhizophorae]|uniref:Autophagy-related protein 27 n=1 Tax=Lineolata rhizophorae TaxID=578093 RepID=A0A6A6PDQ2_9PEZI|nr:autophagy-related protein 27 [Lineolata rhizophorae]
MRTNPLSVSAFLALPSLISAVTIDCSNVVAGSRHFDLSPLKGPHSVEWITSTPPTVSNFTFTLDVCAPLGKISGVPDADQCPHGTRVCGVKTDYNEEDDIKIVDRVVPIAGDYPTSNGRALDPMWTRLRDSASNTDSNKEGLRLELHGGKYPEKRKGQKQKAVIEFLCDPDRTGLEGIDGSSLGPSEGEVESALAAAERRIRREEPEGDGDDSGDDDDADDPEDDHRSLKFISYKVEGEDNIMVLRLSWLTKHACERDTNDGNGSSGSGHWGFFTWFIIILFLAVAAYLIFGSWLNYNRYGARGWDLVPHGDTIRDFPYLFKDWARRVMSSFQGGGSRGGYSAV